jgi:hypothetical protein
MTQPPGLDQSQDQPDDQDDQQQADQAAVAPKPAQWDHSQQDQDEDDEKNGLQRLLLAEMWVASNALRSVCDALLTQDEKDCYRLKNKERMETMRS